MAVTTDLRNTTTTDRANTTWHTAGLDTTEHAGDQSTTWSTETSPAPFVTNSVPTDTAYTKEAPVIPSTTAAPSAWKAVSFGLIGVVAALLLLSIILTFILCKQKKRLKKANDTLYTRDNEHSYTPLKGAPRKGPGVELTHISQIHDEEEIDSPAFFAPPPPPAFPRSATQTSVDKPTELPTRRTKAPEATAKAKKKKKPDVDKEKLVKSEPKDEKDGINNKGFSNTDEKVFSKPNYDVTIVVEHDDDGTYEMYDEDLYRKIKATDKSSGDQVDVPGLAVQQAYEIPVETKTKSKSRDADFIRRQSSSSGLPEMCFTSVETSQTTTISTSVPLQSSIDDIYDNDEVESGLPSSSEPLTLEDLQAYEDVELSVVEETAPNVTEHNHENLPTLPATEDIETEPQLMYDSGEIGPKEESDHDSEPGLYEDCESEDMIEDHNNEPEMNEDMGQDTSNAHFTGETEEDIAKGVHNLPEVEDIAVISRNDMTKLEEFGRHPDEINSASDHSTSDSEISELEGFTSLGMDILAKNQTQGLVPPVVPPRRDLLSKQSFSSDTSDSHDKNDRENKVSTENIPEVVLRKAESIPRLPPFGDKSPVAQLHSPTYFLDMEENSEELSEEHQKRVSVHKMGDSEMSLQELLQLYGNKSKENTVEENAKETTSDPSPNPEHSLSGSNGFLANGGVVDNDEYGDDDNIYDVPPPVYNQQ